MTSEPTAWEEINPATALARQPEQRSQSLDRLRPASNEVFRNELTACLALVVPVGMTEESRREWLAVAWKSLDHLPADVLAVGCKAARQTCDHPSKIVPTIIAETREMMGWRRQTAEYTQPQLPSPPVRRHIADRDRKNFTAEDWTELNAYLEAVGATARYDSDGSKRTA